MSTSNTFSKGINTDVLPKYQEEGTYRFALNAVLETEEGEMPSVSNEEGNASCSIDFPSTKKIIGSALTDTDETVLFLYDPEGNHEIGVHNPDTCTYETYVTDPCLNFSDQHPVNALVKIREGCNRVVYFTDNYNPYRVVDLDDLRTSHYPPSSLNGFDPNIVDCNRLKYSKDFFLPCVNLYEGISNSGIEENAGGNIKVGVYYFAVRFLDLKLNPTPWTMITRGSAIGDEPFSHTLNTNTINLYDGGSNIETSPFFVNPTDKVIKLLITGTSYQADYFQVAVVKRTGDDGTIEAVDILKPEPWTIGTVKYTYDGNPDKVERTGSLEELLIPPVKIEKVAAQESKDQRLFLANTSYTKKDFSSLQRFASKIKTEWAKTAITNSINSGVRQANYYSFNGSFMEDETYALGIVYIFSDGDLSPVCHIPGRAPNQVPGTAFNPLIGSGGVPSSGGADWDTGVGAYGSVNPSFPDHGRWRYTSTALQYNSGTLTGLMGYHETLNETYPNIVSCDDHVDGYWGRDWQGNLITPEVTKIRHHRMPGAELRDAAGNAEGFKTGVKFSNVAYPEGLDIVGHFFVYGDRTFNKTIQGKGVLIPKRGTVLNTVPLKPFDYLTSPASSLFNRDYLFFSGDGLLNNKLIDGSYFKTEKILRDLNFEAGGASAVTQNHTTSIQTDPDGGNATSNTETNYRYFTKYIIPAPSELVNTISTNILAVKSYDGALQGTETVNPTDGTILVNNSINNNFQFIHTANGPVASVVANSGNWRGRMYFGAIRNWNNVFANLYTIQYKRMNNCSPQESNPNPATTYTYYGGDTAVNRVSFVEFDYKQTGLPPGNVTFDTDAAFISFLSQDSNINYEFRHGSTTELKSIYFQPANVVNMATNHSQFAAYLNRKKYAIDVETWGMYPETYNYNKSFSFLDGIQLFYPVPFNFQFCNVCTEDHPYRVYYSEVDNQETALDWSRIIYENNYQDLSGLNGEITDLFTNFDNLYATTVRSLYMLPVNAQTLQSDLSTVYLGTGTTLGIPAKELKNTQYGFGGQQYFKSRVSTEYGTFFVDAISKRPFLLSSSLEDISLGGMRTFWQNEGKVSFEEQFMKLTGKSYNIKSTSSPIGVGYISTYDPRYKRVIVHKRDFKILPEWESKFQYYPQATDDPSSAPIYDAGVLWFNGFNFYYCNGLEPIVHEKITFDQVEYFENTSFTLSYSMLTRKWASFHSYLPSYIYNNSKEYFSQPDEAYTQALYKHNAGEFQTYYEKRFAHIVDMIMQQNPYEGKLSSAVTYTSKVKEFVDSAKDWREIPITYSAFVGYNSNQTTGLQFLAKKTTFDADTSSNVALTQLTDNQWRINNIRDLAANNLEPIWDSSWATKATTPYEYVDRLMNIPNINYNKDLFEVKRLRDHYLGLRFYFYPLGNYKITTDLAVVTTNNRNR